MASYKCRTANCNNLVHERDDYCEECRQKILDFYIDEEGEQDGGKEDVGD